MRRCPKCGSSKRYEITTRNRFKCASCGHQYSLTSRTADHAAKVSLKTIRKIQAMLEAQPRPSIAEISRQTRMSYRGAYYLVKRLEQNIIQSEEYP